MDKHTRIVIIRKRRLMKLRNLMRNMNLLLLLRIYYEFMLLGEWSHVVNENKCTGTRQPDVGWQSDEREGNDLY